MVIWSKSQLFIALSLFSPVSSFSLLPQQPSRDLPPFPTSHRPPRLELISETGAKRTSTRRPTFPDPPPPLLWSESAGICHGSRRFVRMPPELPVRISPSFLHQIFRVRYGSSPIFHALTDGRLGFGRFHL